MHLLLHPLLFLLAAQTVPGGLQAAAWEASSRSLVIQRAVDSREQAAAVRTVNLAGISLLLAEWSHSLDCHGVALSVTDRALGVARKLGTSLSFRLQPDRLLATGWLARALPIRAP